ncbi:MAG: hypothetical protein ACM3NT_01945 [Methylocystaceae bacterium]
MELDRIRRRLYWLRTIGWLLVILGVSYLWFMFTYKYTHGGITLGYVINLWILGVILMIPGFIVLGASFKPLSMLDKCGAYPYDQKIIKRMWIKGLILGALGVVFSGLFLYNLLTGGGGLKINLLPIGMGILILIPGAYLIIRSIMITKHISNP